MKTNYFKATLFLIGFVLVMTGHWCYGQNIAIDDVFNAGGSGPDDTVKSVIEQPDGKFLIAGSFGTYNGSEVPARLARINPDGSLDPSFNAGNMVTANNNSKMLLQPDGKIIVGGDFGLATKSWTFS